MTSSRGPSAAFAASASRGFREVGVVDAPVGESDPLGGRPVEHLTEQYGRGSHLRADGPAEHPRVTPARVQADLDEAGVELRPGAGDPDIAPERHVHAGADGGAVHGRDGRQRRARDPQEAFVDRAEPGPVARAAEVAEVGAGAERGGAPVTTIAPTPSSASISSMAATMSSTMGRVSALRRSGSSSVRVATRSAMSTCTRVMQEVCHRSRAWRLSVSVAPYAGRNV